MLLSLLATVFLGYRRDDSAGHAGRLYDALGRRLGPGSVFRDIDALEPGQDFVAAIHARLADCRVFLAVIGRDWVDARDATGQQRLALADDYVRLEVAAALARSGVRLIPVFVEGATMPPAEQLPEDLRGLTRLQGLSLRDETWDTDVDRLVASITKTLGSRAIRAAATTRVGRRQPRWLIPGIVVIAIAVLAYAASDFGDRRSGGTESTTTTPSNTPPVAVEAHAIALPRMVEAVAGHRIDTVLSGSIAPHGDMTTVRFRVRISNEGSEAVRVWGNDFQLEVRGSRLSATTDVSEAVYGHSLEQVVIDFEVPTGTQNADLIISPGLDDATIPLDLTPRPGPVGTEVRDTSDALSRAVIISLPRDPRRLLNIRGAEYTLASVSARRFINAIRLMVSVRLTNRSTMTTELDSNDFKVEIPGRTVVAYGRRSEYVEPGESATLDLPFQFAPGTTEATLRATVDGRSAAVRFDLPPP
jgi:hypothetical protein